MSKKVIQFMDTSFRDGFQSVFSSRVLTDDFLPAVKATVDAGITNIEAGGGARFQNLFFYCGESAFDMMDRFRKEVGPNVTLQTLARGINVVALSQCPRDIIDLHAKLFKKHGMTTIRNFDALNDVRNLEFSGERIAHHGLNHQVVITMMELPPGCSGAHTPEFYTDRLKQIIDANIPFDSICFKDASGTSNPRKVNDTLKAATKTGIRRHPAVVPYPRYRRSRHNPEHGGHRGWRRRHRPGQVAGQRRHLSTGHPVDDACPEGHRLYPRSRL